ncbi:hypothetical protein [Hymenobacter cellulosivorans]|uniref:CcoQ/FixQ family Cbb3-type cytochrome c oxidase assembly chaperone n=1 Tax=Hymenobacter cellulosivorans TaxID=2932249 RepID=A0ABY4F3B4_9BACT|nr:hypothetical protein [Hymenobacter cellulosivorans]UOQ51143.1 hypothetical protein MUN80_15385 [Hymenobacter cellulosivorans]
MHKNVLQSIAGIEIYPLISLAIFFLFFLGLLAYVVLANRRHITTMSQLPLAADTYDETLYSLNPDVLC